MRRFLYEALYWMEGVLQEATIRLDADESLRRATERAEKARSEAERLTEIRDVIVGMKAAGSSPTAIRAELNERGLS